MTETSAIDRRDCVRRVDKEGVVDKTGIDVIAHAELTMNDIAGLRGLFDDEYRNDFGDWNPDLPYGYAPHDIHVVTRRRGKVVGHVGWGRRAILAGDREIVIAGVGGVLVSDGARGELPGSRLMSRAAESMTVAGGIAFGYLGCGEEVVSFYSSWGWTRISATERSIGRAGHSVLESPGQPLLVLHIDHRLGPRPFGEIDLRGRAW